MTTATFEQDGSRFAVMVGGHADHNPGGPDIVCAACSTLVYTLLQAVRELEESGAIRDMRYGSDDGRFCLMVQAATWARERVEIAMKIVASGFSLLWQEYPEHVRYNRCEGGEKLF